MGLLSIAEMIHIVRKYFLRIVAVSLLAGFIGGYVVNTMQTYTCTLGFKYNHEEASQGLARDGESKLDPYEIQNPVVIRAALQNMGMDSTDSDVKGIRQNIAITKVVTDLDKEVSESAALLGEKYDVIATEYEMKFTYDAALGDEFGAKMFSNIVKEYDKFLLSKYYNKKNVPDFAKVIKDSDADYMIIADTMNQSIEDAIAYMDEMAGYYPEYRSNVTGYTFSEISLLYQNLRDIQYAKYYGNIREGNLAKDTEMIIKSYQKKVKDLREEFDVNFYISENYKNEIKTFYDSYKESGLYLQAERVQSNVDSTNNRDQDVLDDRELEEYKNTYDQIILNYVDRAGMATDALRSVDYYNEIIAAFAADNVPLAEKKRLIEKNEVLFDEITVLSKKYSSLANDSINELYASRINNDLQYLIVPEVSKDKPVKLIAVFLMIVMGGLCLIAVFAYELLRKFVDFKALKKSSDDDDDEKIIIDTSEMSELHQLLYEQYLDDFDEFFLVYQSMISNDESKYHKEVFMRWRSSQLGMVSPGTIIKTISELGLFKPLNEWIIKSVCRDIAALRTVGERMPVVHINFPYSQIDDFALNDIILKQIKKYDVPAENLCFELMGKDIGEFIGDIMLLEEMGIGICIDKFENSEEEFEIIDGVKPSLIKMSLDILNSDMYATTEEDIMESNENMLKYFSAIIEKCHTNGIGVCICGIEKKSQDALISGMDFDFRQGYYYGSPEKLEL